MKLLYVLPLLIASLSAQAELKESARLEEGTRGGGDQCENRIQEIRSDISAWIKNGGSAGLSLPKGTALKEYNLAMNEAIQSSRIACVGPGDIGFPVAITDPATGREVAKTCAFDLRNGTITCDAEKFNSMKEESDQYVLVHHELAGLAGIERPQGAVSRYEISNQISDFLETKIVKRLAVKRAKPHMCVSSVAEAKKAVCTVTVDKTIPEIRNAFEKFGMRFPLWQTERMSNGHYARQLTQNKPIYFDNGRDETVLLSVRPERFVDFATGAENQPRVDGEQKMKLGPLLDDFLYLSLKTVGGKTEISLLPQSIIGGVPVLSNLANCQMKDRSGESCMSFRIAFSKIGGLSVSVSLQEPHPDLEVYTSDARLTIENGLNTWLIESYFGHGGDGGEEDFIRVGRDAAGNFIREAHQGSFGRN